MLSRPLLIAACAALLGMSALAQAQSTAASAPTGAAPKAAAAAAPAGEVAEGKMAWYGKRFAGRKTASGQRFNPNALTMAHKTLPFGTMVRVTNVKNNRSVVVRVNDRGPSRPDLVGDLSLAAARSIRMLRSGIADVKLEVVGQGKKK